VYAAAMKMFAKSRNSSDAFVIEAVCYRITTHNSSTIEDDIDIMKLIGYDCDVIIKIIFKKLILTGCLRHATTSNNRIRWQKGNN
jgi:hypothetical protein